MLHTLSGQLGDRSLAPVGIHCILELYDCPANLLNDVPFIQQALRDAAKRACSTLLGEMAYQFEPQGVTALALLAESHISIHTWPENGYAAADVFTCGQHTQPEQAGLYLVEAFQSGRHSLCRMPRRTLAFPAPQPIGQPHFEAPAWKPHMRTSPQEGKPCPAAKLAQISG